MRKDHSWRVLAVKSVQGGDAEKFLVIRVYNTQHSLARKEASQKTIKRRTMSTGMIPAKFYFARDDVRGKISLAQQQERPWASSWASETILRLVGSPWEINACSGHCYLLHHPDFGAEDR